MYKIKTAKAAAKAAAERDSKLAASVKKANKAAAAAVKTKADAAEQKRRALKQLDAVKNVDIKAAKAAAVATMKKKDADRKLRIAEKVAEMAAASLSSARVIFSSFGRTVFLGQF